MARTSGLVWLRYSTGRAPSSARLAGTSGWTPASRRPNGLERRKRSSSTWQSFTHPSGAPLLLSLAALPLNAWSAMKHCWTLPKQQRVRWRRVRRMLAVCAQERLTLTLRRSLPARTPLTWMRTKRRCSRRRALVSRTPAARRPSARPARSSWKKPSAWPTSRSAVSSRQLAWSANLVAGSASTSTMARRFPSSGWHPLASTTWRMRGSAPRKCPSKPRAGTSRSSD
mmetsp:Transcript_28110/g.82315  ORF Transcript_28110/g.82315 Transcript_28110/m.82315 type:complete len:227 (+) Transcript_28110:101-781(+)